MEQTAASGPKAPELSAPAEQWVNTDGKAIRLFDEKGHRLAPEVVVLAFWTHGCINCQRTVPYWNEWARQYQGKGNTSSDVRVISVHTPELDFERKPENVRRYIQQKGITFPTVLDNDYRIWNAYKVEAWPTTLLIDKQGRIRARWEGELNWQNSRTYREVEKAIERLRKEPVSVASAPDRLEKATAGIAYNINTGNHSYRKRAGNG